MKHGRRRARRALWVTLAGVLSGVATGGLRAEGADRPPNILLILADDIGVDMVDFYDEGSQPARMPVVGRLAEEGVLFRNAWATPTCSPTRATLLTGRHPFRHGVGVYFTTRVQAELPWDELILPELLDLHPRLGYRHGMIGKWHLGNYVDAPVLAGFGTFAGSRSNFDLGEDYYRWLKVECGVESVSRKYATTDTVDDALEFIASTPEPWFLYLPFNAAHARFQNPPDHLHSDRLYPDTKRCDKRRVYHAMIEALDTEIGRLLDGMGHRRGNTNVIFMADNGSPAEVLAPPTLPRHGKLSLYEGGLRVPLVIAGPDVRDPGREVRALVGATDLFATCAEMAGLDLSRDLPDDLVTDSISLMPYLEDAQAPAQRGFLYSEHFEPVFSSEPRTERRAIRNERYKLIVRVRPTPRYEFYDLQRDPHEARNLVREPWDDELERQFVNLTSAMDELRGY